MAEKFSRYDSADYLRTEAEIAAYLDACKEEGGDDPALMAHVLGIVARARIMMPRPLKVSAFGKARRE